MGCELIVLTSQKASEYMQPGNASSQELPHLQLTLGYTTLAC